MDKNNNELRMICEQGDLGLWNEPVNNKDMQVIKETEEEKNHRLQIQNK